MSILENGVIEHLAKQLSVKLPGDKEVKYSVTKDFEISHEMVFESLSFSSSEHDHGLVITERKDGSFEIRVPLRYPDLHAFTTIEEVRYLYDTSVGGYVVSREPEDPRILFAGSETMGYLAFVSMILTYFGQLSYLEILLHPESDVEHNPRVISPDRVLLSGTLKTLYMRIKNIYIGDGDVSLTVEHKRGLAGLSSLSFTGADSVHTYAILEHSSTRVTLHHLHKLNSKHNKTVELFLDKGSNPTGNGSVHGKNLTQDELLVLMIQQFPSSKLLKVMCRNLRY